VNAPGTFEYLHSVMDGLGHLLEPRIFIIMLIGIGIGLIVGFVPGIGSLVALAILLPFTFGMSPFEAFALLLGMYAVVTTTGDLTAILFGVPGESDSAALVLDGYPLTRRGEGSRAMAASIVSGAVGGVIGAVTLAIAVPVIAPLVLAIGPPETFLLTMLGATIIGSVSGRSVLKGLAVAGVGLLMAAVGTNPQTGIYRYTFDSLYLADGLPLIPVAVGMFAIAELINLHCRRTSIAVEGKNSSTVLDGVKDVFLHWKAMLRGSVIGVGLGMMPGVGGPVGQWMAYGSAKMASKHPEEFGKGSIEGVISPGASNNSKEGGQLIPTLAFGIPGSAAMAVLLGAFLILGLEPGPAMLTTDVDVTFFMVGVLVVANIIGAGICLSILKYVVRITLIRGELLVPFILIAVLVGGVASSGKAGDILLVMSAGLIAYFMQRFGWPIVPLLVGFVLGEKAEDQLALSVNIYGGWGWLFRPLDVALLVVLLLAVVLAVRANRRANARLDQMGTVEEPVARAGSMAVAVVILVGSGGAFLMTLGWPLGARVYPQVIAAGVFLSALAVLVAMIARGTEDDDVPPSRPDEPAIAAVIAVPVLSSGGSVQNAGVAVGQPQPALVQQREERISQARGFLRSTQPSSAITWFVGAAVTVWLLGFVPAIVIFCALYLRLIARTRWLAAISLSGAFAVAFYVVLVWGLAVTLPPTRLSW
jgi:putative tricarboxylic transport membrane protein